RGTRDGRRARAGHSGYYLRVRVEPSEYLRHAGAVLVAAISAADHCEGVAGKISRARLALTARPPSVCRSSPSRSLRNSGSLAIARLGGLVAVDLCRGDTKPRRPHG